MQNLALWTWWDVTSSAKSSVITLMIIGWSLANNKNRIPLRYPTLDLCLLRQGIGQLHPAGQTRPNDSNFDSKNLWLTKSNSLAISKYTTSAVFQSSINRAIASSNIRGLERHDRWGRKPCWRPVNSFHWLRNERMALSKAISKTLHATEVRLSER